MCHTQQTTHRRHLLIKQLILRDWPVLKQEKWERRKYRQREAVIGILLKPDRERPDWLTRALAHIAKNRAAVAAPLRKAPSGTSLIKRRRTDCLIKPARISAP